jgi:hypothetical protein
VLLFFTGIVNRVQANVFITFFKINHVRTVKESTFLEIIVVIICAPELQASGHSIPGPHPLNVILQFKNCPSYTYLQGQNY